MPDPWAVAPAGPHLGMLYGSNALVELGIPPDDASRIFNDHMAARMDGEPDLAGMFDRGEIDPLVELLLECYYDPLYRGSEAGKRYEVAVEAEDAGAAADEIIRWIEARVGA